MIKVKIQFSPEVNVFYLQIGLPTAACYQHKLSGNLYRYTQSEIYTTARCALRPTCDDEHLHACSAIVLHGVCVELGCYHANYSLEADAAAGLDCTVIC